jgi:hypothetical protein
MDRRRLFGKFFGVGAAAAAGLTGATVAKAMPMTREDEIASRLSAVESLQASVSNLGKWVWDIDRRSRPPSYASDKWIGYPVKRYIDCETCGEHVYYVALDDRVVNQQGYVALDDRVVNQQGESLAFPVYMERGYALVEIGGALVQGDVVHRHRPTTGWVTETP